MCADIFRFVFSKTIYLFFLNSIYIFIDEQTLTSKLVHADKGHSFDMKEFYCNSKCVRVHVEFQMLDFFRETFSICVIPIKKKKKGKYICHLQSSNIFGLWDRLFYSFLPNSIQIWCIFLSIQFAYCCMKGTNKNKQTSTQASQSCKFMSDRSTKGYIRTANHPVKLL